MSVVRIDVLLLPVASTVRPPDPIPSLQPHYGPSALIRIGPPQCSASVLSPRGFRRLGFSLGIRATGSCSSAQKPAFDSRPLYAGRRPPSHQAPGRLIPEGPYAPGFDDPMIFNDASSKGSLSFVSRMLTCPRSSLSFRSNAHHHGSLPQQLGVVWDLLLKADPEGPSLISHAAVRHRFHFALIRYMCLCSTLGSKKLKLRKEGMPELLPCGIRMVFNSFGC